VTVPSPEDFQLAEKDALLQLRIGRSAHLYAVFVSAALALDGVLLLFFTPQLPSLTSSDSGGVAFARTFFLVLPLIAGLSIAGIGLASKWEVYNLWPWEAHFSTTVAAVGVNALILVVYVLRLGAVAPFATLNLVPWFYPVELAGISLALFGIVLTWSGWSGRQWAAAICALAPIATALLVYFPPATTTGTSDALAVSLFLSAFLYQTSGSFLHLISSGTRPHERELITSGQSRMFRHADEIRKREEALHFRESAIVKREADVENSVLSIRRQNDSLKEARLQIDDLEEDYRKRSDQLAEKERSWAGQLAELDARSRLVEDKSKALEIREEEVQRLLPQVSAREARLVEREGEQTKRDVELTQRTQELDQRQAGIAETEARLEARRKELDQKTQDILRREGEVAATDLTRKPGAAVPASIGQDLAQREAKLQQFKTVLDEQNVLLGKRFRDATEKAKSAEVALQKVAEKEAGLAVREAAVRQREADLTELLKAADQRRTRYDTAVKEYEGRLQEYGRQSAATAQKGVDLEQRIKALTDRENAVAAREQRLRTSSDELSRRESELTAREVSLEAAEAEVSLRRQAAHRGELSIAGLAGGVAASDRSASFLSSPGLGGHGPASVGPVRDLSTAPIAGVPIAAASNSSTLSAPANRRFSDRLPSGTPRLDDLLLGGIPARGHVVLVGDPFVGKEVVLYAFIAEGLKRGEPVVLVTAARSPSEIAQSLGVVLPQFREYEQMGMVQWIDASGSGGAPDAHHAVPKSSDDRAGILSNLVQAANRADAHLGQSFRVGFLGLSAVLAHGDERASFSFLQNVVGILKPRNALAMYSLEAGALSEAQVETLLSRMDGALVFRQDRDRLLLSVKGFGDVETRDWVECRVTQRALVVGSFALMRIR
jgi:KaiC/GvpD/RAD55 family RecA-like ATPase